MRVLGAHGGDQAVKKMTPFQAPVGLDWVRRGLGFRLFAQLTWQLQRFTITINKKFAIVNLRP